MLKSRFFPAFAFLCLSAAPSLALTLECRVPQSSAGGGYITELYVFDYDESSGQAVAADGVIYHYNDEQPKAAKVEDTAKKLVFSWNVQMTNGYGQMINMLYRAAYFKSDGLMTIRAVPGGYSNDFEGRGRCKAV